MVINIDSKEFCDILNFVRKCKFIDDIKFEIDPIINDSINITISKYHRGIGYRHRKVLDVRDLISGTFGISEAIKGITRSMERDLSNYIEKETNMIKIEKTMVTGWEPAIRGMRNPMNSWDKSDSVFSFDGAERYGYNVIIGENDKNLMRKLISSGSDHAKFRRMIVVYCDVTAPLYWWKEYDTYKVGTVANSCSTMHKIAAKEFELGDFSTDHLIWTML